MPTQVTVFDSGTGVSLGNSFAGVGLAGGAVSTSSGTATTELGTSANYTVIVQIPVPFFQLNLNLNLLGDFILPALTPLGVPKAYIKFLTQYQDFFANVQEDAMDLIRAIPEVTVTIAVKFGSVTVLNVRLVAEKEPVTVAIPSFQLALPNMGADVSLGLTLPFVPLDPIVIRVPIPVPIFVAPPLLGISGGQVSASATGEAGLGAVGAAGAVGTAGIGSTGAAVTPGGFSSIALPSATSGSSGVGGVIPGVVATPAGATATKPVTSPFAVSSGVILPPL